MEIDIHSWWLGVASFALAWAAHALWWRASPNRRSVTALAWIFIVVPSAGYALAVPGALAAWIMHLWLGVNYIAIYPALQATSPTLKMLCLISRRGGIAEDALVRETAQPSLLEARVEDLLSSGLARRGTSGLELSARGRVLAETFFFYRRLIGLPRGEG